MLLRGCAGLAQIDTEPEARHADFFTVIRQPTLRQERLDHIMCVPIRNCSKLKVDDIGVMQPLLHYIVPHLFFCADESSNMHNWNVVHLEDAGCISVDGEICN